MQGGVSLDKFYLARIVGYDLLKERVESAEGLTTRVKKLGDNNLGSIIVCISVDFLSNVSFLQDL